MSLTKRLVVVLALVMMALMASASAVVAGEWSPGRGEHNGAADHARSECVYNGHDDDDAEDNDLWAMTPSGGVVQSGGQLTAAGARTGDPSLLVPTGVQRFACNPTAQP